jgi:hypothetical protein
MAWFPSHQSLARHPKTHRLMARLKTSRSETVGHLNLFWWWCLDYAPDGSLAGFSAEEVAIAMEWDGDAAALLDALIFAGFIDATDAGLVVHDWDEYGGKIERRKAAHRDRMRESRAADTTEKDGTPGDGDAHVQRTDPARDAHVRTQIREEEKREEETTSQGENDAPDGADDGSGNKNDADANKDKRGTRLSPDAVLTDEWRDAAVKLGYPSEHVDWLFDEFKDYWCAVPGQKGTKLDWLATWRNRVRDTVASGRKIRHLPTKPQEEIPGQEAWRERKVAL